MNYELRARKARQVRSAGIPVILSTAPPRGGFYSWNDRGIEVSAGQAGSSPLQWTERLCSGKLPACHSLFQSRFVIGSERVARPPKIGAKMSVGRRCRPCGEHRLGRRSPSLPMTRTHVTLSAATSEVAESKGLPRFGKPLFLRRPTDHQGILRLSRGLARSE